MCETLDIPLLNARSTTATAVSPVDGLLSLGEGSVYSMSVVMFSFILILHSTKV